MTLEEFEELEREPAEEIKIGESLIILDDLALESKDYDITVRTGVWCEKDETGEFEPDWGLTLIHKTGDSPENYLYIEQGNIFSALNNYANIADIDVEHLYDALDIAA